MSKLTFTAYGNCQAGALAQVLLDYPEFECRYTYRPVPPVHLLTPSSAGAVLETVHSSDFLLYQHMFNVTGGPELTTPKILAALPTQAERIHLSGALIFQGYTPHLVVLPKLPALLANEHDCGIVQGFLSGLDADTIVEVIQDPDFYDATSAWSGSTPSWRPSTNASASWKQISGQGLSCAATGAPIGFTTALRTHGV